MPMYEFQCRQCEHRFERLLSVAVFTKRKHSQHCPLCGARCNSMMTVPVPVRTSTRYLSRFGTLADQFGQDTAGLARRVAIARKAGGRPSYNDVYDPTLATYPGDPDGFIPSTDAKGHVKRVLAKRGVGCKGGICPTPTGPGREPPQIPLAEDIIQDEMARQIKRDPGLAANKQKLREEILDRHSYKRSS